MVDLDHALGISNRFYLGLFSSALLLQIWGFFQSIVGTLMIAGLPRRWVYPVVIAINGVSMLGIWRSIIDLWGWVLEGTNVLFFPSLIIFAASLLLWAYRDEDETALYRLIGRRNAGTGSRRCMVPRAVLASIHDRYVNRDHLPLGPGEPRPLEHDPCADDEKVGH